MSDGDGPAAEDAGRHGSPTHEAREHRAAGAGGIPASAAARWVSTPNFNNQMFEPLRVISMANTNDLISKTSQLLPVLYPDVSALLCPTPSILIHTFRAMGTVCVLLTSPIARGLAS